MKDEFQDFWHANFPDCPPVSYLFRHKYADRWLHIDTLPWLEKYAKNRDEVLESLRKQKVLFEDFFGKEEDCYLVMGGFLKSLQMSFYKRFSSVTKLFTCDADPIPRRSFEPHAKKSEIFQVCFGKRKIRFRNVERMLVDLSYQSSLSELNYFFILHEVSKRIFVPCDGGVDLIFENFGKRDAFKEKYEDWLFLPVVKV